MNKEEAIAIIRSLLSSTKDIMDLHTLSRDFKNEAGINIPLFGYENLSEFLCSSPENFLVVGKYPNQVVKPVTNKKSSHILSLVERQKTRTSIKDKNKTFSYKKYYPSHSDNSCGSENSKVDDSESALCTSNSVEDNLINYLKTCSNGATFEDIQKNVKVFEEWESTMRLHNIIAFIKKFPNCVFYEGRFYEIELFKSKIKNNEIPSNKM